MQSPRLDSLRALLRERGIDAYIVPSGDQHAGEYVPRAWQRRAWLTGFTGSAGDALVTLKDALLWTDSRYFLRAERELEGGGFRLMKSGIPGEPGMQEWIGQNLGAGAGVGYDPRLLSHERTQELERELGARGLRVVSIEENLVDRIWRERPALPLDSAIVWDTRYAGESVPSKLARVREKMAEVRADAHVVTRLDDIAWLYNLRGTDVPYNPLLISYALVTRDHAWLFVDPRKVPPAGLDPSVTPRGYDTFGDALEEHARGRSRFWIDAMTASRWIVERAGGVERAYLGPGPIPMFKAVKNAVEVEGKRSAHIRDGAAMVRFLRWLEEAVPAGGVTELSVARELDRFRAQGQLYRGPSFEPIVGYRAHGAIVHYEATEESSFAIHGEDLLLVDSGGQYLDGTTDITRTVALGRPTAEQRVRFTLVLKGHIQIALAPFPRGTSGGQLDVLARRALWDAGLNYGHGTGHGVGAFLCVHEGPHSISPTARSVPLEPGMVVSNEPGYYKDGAYGIRIENLVTVVEDPDRQGFLRFSNLTLCPIDRNLVEPDMLSPGEREYLNTYHTRVRDTLSPLVDGKDRAWLDQATEPL